jgi:hypothetical protein
MTHTTLGRFGESPAAVMLGTQVLTQRRVGSGFPRKQPGSARRSLGSQRTVMRSETRGGGAQEVLGSNRAPRPNIGPVTNLTAPFHHVPATSKNRTAGCTPGRASSRVRRPFLQGNELLSSPPLQFTPESRQARQCGCFPPR